MNPMVIKTQRGARRLGELIETWSTSASSRPGKTSADGRTVTMSKAEFLTALGDEFANEMEFREGVETVELAIRQSDIFTILLPEPQVFGHHREKLADDGKTTVGMPRIYLDINPTDLNVNVMNKLEMNPSFPANYDVKFSEETLDAFLMPYMAGYVCTQCM